MRPHLVRLLLLNAVAILATACGERMTNVDYGNREQILFIGCGSEPSSLDPHIATGLNESFVLISLLEGLTTLDPATLEVKPGAARSWEISDDGRRYTFHLDPDGRWSNGDPVTAGDFVFAYQRMLSPELGAEYAYILFVMRNAAAFKKGELEDFSQVGVRAIDDHTLEIELEEPTAFFLQLLSHFSWYPVHPPTILAHGDMADRVSAWTRPGNYVGNGPFRMTFWQLNNRIVVERNPYYRDNGNVTLNGIHFFPIEDLNTEERAFRSGYLHLTYTVPIHRIDWYRANQPDRIRFDTSLGVYYYAFNTRRPPLDDPRVRRALTLSLDREALTAHVLKAGQKPAYFFTPPNCNGYTSEARFDYDPAEARRLLAEAGFPGGDGFPRMELLFNTSESHRTVAEAIQQMWKDELGIEISLLNQEWKAYLESRKNADFDIVRAGWFGDYNDPYTFLGLFAEESENNHTGWTDPEYDRLLRASLRESDPEKRIALFNRAEQLLLDDMPVLPIYFYVRSLLIDPAVEGWPPNLLDYHPYNRIRLEPERAAVP